MPSHRSLKARRTPPAGAAGEERKALTPRLVAAYLAGRGGYVSGRCWIIQAAGGRTVARAKRSQAPGRTSTRRQPCSTLQTGSHTIPIHNGRGQLSGGSGKRLLSIFLE